MKWMNGTESISPDSPRRLGKKGRTILAAAAAVAVLFAMPAQAADALRWKFTKGETLKYTMEQKTTQEMKAMEREFKTTLNQTIDLHWTIKNVAGEVAEMSQTIDRVRTKVEAPGNTFEFDSQGFDLRLMYSQSNVSSIPTSGSNLVIVANVNDVLYFRIFDADGKLVVDTDQTRLTTRAGPIQDLKRQLDGVRPPHELTRSEKDKVVTAVTSIVDHTHSQSAKNPEGPIAVMLTPMLKALVGAEFSFKMNGRGELSDVQVPKQLMESLSKAGPAATAGGMFSEEGLKNLISQSSLTLPENGLEKGGSWTQQARVPVPMLGTMLMNKTYTYQGSDQKDPNQIKIGLDTKVTLEPAADSNVAVEVKNQKGDGEFSFDNQAGRVRSSHVNDHMEMSITVQGQTLQQTTDTVTSMTLADGATNR